MKSKKMIKSLLLAVVSAGSLWGVGPSFLEKELLGTSYSGGVATLDWVIRFDMDDPHSDMANGPYEIVDVFNGVQTYLPPTEAHPDGWSVTPDPSGFTWQNDHGYFYRHFFPQPNMPVTNDGDGDGFAPIPYTASNGDKRFYYLNHHMPETYALFGCRGECSGTSWPKRLPDGDASSTETSASSGRPHTVIYNRKLYYNVTRANDSGIGCYDLENDSECGYIKLSNLGRSSGAKVTIDGLTKVGNALYTIDGNRVAYKVNLSGTGAMSLAGSHDFSTNGMTINTTDLDSSGSQAYMASSQVVGNKVYFSKSDMNIPANRQLVCLDTTTMNQCSGWSGAVSASSLEKYGAVNTYVHYTAGMTPDAICVASSMQYGGQQCFDLNSGAPVSRADPFASNPIRFSIGFETTVGSKTYFPNASKNNVVCYDWAAQAPCSPTSSYVKSYAKTYGTALDNDGCLWVLGHNNILWPIDFGDGACRNENNFVVEDTYDASKNWCATDNPDWHYTSLEIQGIVPSDFDDLNITFYDANGNVIATQPIPTNSGATYSINLNTAPFNNGEPIHYKIEGTWSSNADPDNVPPRVMIGYEGPPQEFCFKTQVPCPVTGDIVNQAFLRPPGMSENFDSAEVVTPGDQICQGATEPPKQCLDAHPTLSCTPAGWRVELGTFTPSSYNPSNTQMQIISPNGATATKWGTAWYLNGVSPGDTVQLSMQGVQAGAGSLEGDDLCCDGDINITIPQDQTCEVEQPHVYVRKLYNEADHTFQINLRIMNTIYPPQIVRITDTIPPGVTITGVDPRSSSEWACSNAFPISGPASLNCVYTGTMPVTGIKDLYLTSTIDNTQMPAENCVDAGVVGTDGTSIYTNAMMHHCVTIPHEEDNQTDETGGCTEDSDCSNGQMCHQGMCEDLPNDSNASGCTLPKIIAQKRFMGCDAAFSSCTFQLTLTNSDPINPYNGDVFVYDDTTAPGVGSVSIPITSVSPSGLCPTTPTTTPIVCVTPMSFAPGESKTFTITVNPYGSGAFAPGTFDANSENCFRGSPSLGIPAGNYDSFETFGAAAMAAGFSEANPPPCMSVMTGNCVQYRDNPDNNDSNTTQCTEDGNDCAQGQICHQGQCIDDPPVPDCDNGGCGFGCEICQNGSSCIMGACIAQSNDGEACDDGNASTVNDTVINGICVGSPMDCDDGNASTIDSAVNGMCEHTPAGDDTPSNEGQACDDGNASTVGDTIINGICVGTPVNIGCTANSQCPQGQFCHQGYCAQIPPTVVVPRPKPVVKPVIKPVPKPELSIKKRAPKICKAGDPCTFTMQITNRGTARYRGPLSINDRPREFVGRVIRSSRGWKCRTGRNGYLCTNPRVDLAPGASTTVRMTIRIPQGARGYLRNCARLDQLRSGRARIMAIQTMLSARGFDPNGIDGSMGRGTKRALKAYMQSRGLKGKKGRALAMQELYASFPHVVSQNSCTITKIKKSDQRCRRGQHWNGKRCVVCPKNSRWDKRHKVCRRIDVSYGKKCPKGYVYRNRRCIKEDKKKCGFMQVYDPHTGRCRSKVDAGTVINVIRVINGLRGHGGGGTKDVPHHTPGI